MNQALATRLGFDYGDLPEPERRAMERHAEAILAARDRARRTAAEAVLETGRHLAEAHERYANRGNGTFGAWCEARIGYTHQHALRYIAAFQLFSRDELNHVVQKFDESSMLLLAAPSCPEAARKEAFKLAASQVVAHKDTKAIVDKHKPRDLGAASDGYSPHGTGKKGGKAKGPEKPPETASKPRRTEAEASVALDGETQTYAPPTTLVAVPERVMEAAARKAEPEPSGETDPEWMGKQISALIVSAHRLPATCEARGDIGKALDYALELLLCGNSEYALVRAADVKGAA